jgi:hypothetical protein
MGSWMGGLVAAAASSAPPRPTSLLALWEPTLDGTAYFKEQFRLSFLTDLKRGGLKPPSREALLDELKGQGWTDILGRTVGWPFYQSVVERTLIGEIGEHSPPLLLVCMSVEGPVVDTYRSYEEKLRAKGFPVEYRFVNTNEAWGPGKRRKGSVPLTRMTADWIADTLDTGRQR